LLLPLWHWICFFNRVGVLNAIFTARDHILSKLMTEEGMLEVAENVISGGEDSVENANSVEKAYPVPER
jgi:hypothetical protein